MLPRQQSAHYWLQLCDNFHFFPASAFLLHTSRFKYGVRIAAGSYTKFKQVTVTLETELVSIIR